MVPHIYACFDHHRVQNALGALMPQELSWRALLLETRGVRERDPLIKAVFLFDKTCPECQAEREFEKGEAAIVSICLYHGLITIEEGVFRGSQAWGKLKIILDECLTRGIHELALQHHPCEECATRRVIPPEFFREEPYAKHKAGRFHFRPASEKKGRRIAASLLFYFGS